MPHALLLSPDDQAVTAITDVLQEMSVTCERPLDGVSAAQKLNSQSFDLVLVDCENLPAAKLIFDVCRRGKNGNNPVPIAIVDGRAGLPTAFRLGAELILTKPVAKDQARGTIRTAVGRVRKTVPANESASAQPASAAAVNPATNGSAMTEEHTQAAAAAAVSSQLTNFAEPAPSFVASSLPSAAPAMAASSAATALLDAPAGTTKMHSAVDEIDAPPASPESNQTAPVDSKSTRPLVPSDDPVLAELERMELEESKAAELQKSESRKQSSDKKALDQSSLDKSALDQSSLDKSLPAKEAAESAAPIFSSYQQGQRKTRAPLLALLMLMLAAGGFYTAWTYQPGFRALAQPQIDRVLALVGMATPPSPAPSPAKPSAQPASATTAATAQASPTDSNPSSNLSPATAPDSATSPAGSSSTAATTGAPTGATTGSPATSDAATIPVKPPVKSLAAASTAVAPPASGTSTTAVASKRGDIGLSANKNDSKVDAAATPSNAPLPGETSAVILSSKGAENRLAHSVPAKYPAEAHAEGTVLLKAVVDADGKVEGLRLIEGNATLATAAMQAVKQWRYRPYVRDGKAQIFQTVVIVDFQKP
jgi:TonB family protein